MIGTLTDKEITLIFGVIFFMVCFYFFYQKLNVTQEDIDKSRKSLKELDTERIKGCLGIRKKKSVEK
jgi:preprotein translocase subunit YajC